METEPALPIDGSAPAPEAANARNELGQSPSDSMAPEHAGIRTSGRSRVVSSRVKEATDHAMAAENMRKSKREEGVKEPREQKEREPRAPKAEKEKSEKRAPKKAKKMKPELERRDSAAEGDLLDATGGSVEKAKRVARSRVATCPPYILVILVHVDRQGNSTEFWTAPKSKLTQEQLDELAACHHGALNDDEEQFRQIFALLVKHFKQMDEIFFEKPEIKPVRIDLHISEVYQMHFGDFGASAAQTADPDPMPQQ